jgi:hypothetical protein
MKKYMLAAAAAFALAAPGLAAADSADVGLHYGNIDPDGGDSIDTWGIDGAYSHQMDSGWVLQMDGQHDSLDVGTDIGSSYAAVNLGARSEGHAMYGFAGLSDMLALSFVNVGVGGQLYLGNVTVDGSVGYANSDDADLSVTDANVDGTWFFTDNFGLTGRVGWAQVDDGSNDTDATTLGVGAAWRPDGSNFTFNAGYDSVDGDNDGNVWRLGLTYNIGTSSERERSQSGASFNGARTLYNDTVGLFFF